MNTLIVILGPTGVGKTDVCLRVAEHFCIPIINADSRQLYREIPIGTAAPTPSQQARVRHFFVGTHSIDDYYSASMYEQDVLQLLEKLWEDKRIALLSGGSMMYVDAVCNGIDDIPTVDDEIRVWMKERFASEGLDALCEELRQLDPDYYEIVDRKNYRRVIHALEIIHQSGKTYTSFRTQQTKERPFRILKIGLNRPREELYDRINRRVDQIRAHQGKHPPILPQTAHLVQTRHNHPLVLSRPSGRYHPSDTRQLPQGYMSGALNLKRAIVNNLKTLVISTRIS